MTAYYNEIDPFAAEWLRHLISAGHIAPGDVDTRSIVDVRPDDLKGYAQCHFFAGIGVWSHALRLAGWPDSRPVWTGSCPCQPFSAAGKGGGFDDERHLWPHFHWLIGQCRPPVVLGEQVASKDGLAWLDLVQADLEGTGYASGAVDTCAAGFGAPHIRQRLYWLGVREQSGASPRQRDGSRLANHDWMADTAEPGRQPWGRIGVESDGRGAARVEPGRLCDVGWMGNADSFGTGRERGGLRGPLDREDGQLGPDDAGASSSSGYLEHTESDGWLEGWAEPSWRGAASGRGTIGLADTDLDGLQGRPVEALQREGRRDEGHAPGRSGASLADPRRAGPTNGHWRDADWLFCRDGKWRPVEPGTLPLAHGAPARVGRLRGYGNAINAAQAQGFVEAVQDVLYPALDLRLTNMSEMTNDTGDIFS